MPSAACSTRRAPASKRCARTALRSPISSAPSAASPRVSALAPRIALMLGNLVTGVSIVGIAAMLPELAHGLEVTIAQAGMLVTAGAVILCIGSPLVVWATSRVDRRVLLGGSLAIVALGHFASAL